MKGFIQTKRTAWSHFIEDQSKFVKGTKGKEYALRLKVRIHDSIVSHEGILWISDDASPYSLVLHPQYKIKCTKSEFLDALVNVGKKDGHTFEKYLKKNCEKWAEIIFGNNQTFINTEKFKEKLLAKDLEFFEKSMSDKDLMQFIYPIMNYLHDEHNMPITKQYTDTVYIPAETIQNVTVIGTESKFIFEISHEDKKIIYPKRIDAAKEILHDH